jgi:ketosteroid isomerase-like protein
VSRAVDPQLEQTIRDAYAALVEIWESLHTLFEYDSVEVHEITEGRDGVLVVVRYRGRGSSSGAPVDVPMTHVLDIRDGLVARLAWFGTRDEAAEAAGL